MSDVFLKDRHISDEMFDVVRESERLGNGIIADPYPIWAEKRAEGPVHKSHARELLGFPRLDALFLKERTHYALLDFPTCNTALVDNATFSSSFYDEYLMSQHFGRSILSMGGEEHRRYRNIVQPLFTRQQAMDWWSKSWISEIVDSLVGAMKGETTIDLSKTLCARLPMHTIARAFGLQDEEALEFRHNLLHSSIKEAANPAEREAADEATKTTLRKAIAERKIEPRHDIISALLHTPFIDDDGREARLSEEEIFSFCRVVMTAGGGTTFRQLGITLVALLSNPGQLDAVRQDRKLIEPAIHESLRWNTTLPTFHRLVTEDAELAGVAIPAGSIVDICLAAGNRDPARWENPEKYDLFRPVQRNLAFAGGPHTCLGMFVAQAEMVVAINALLDAFPNLRFSPDHETPRISGSPELRGVTHLTVRLD